MELFARYIVAFVLFATLQLATCQKNKTCTFQPAKDFNATVFYLDASGTRFRYPDASGQLKLSSNDALSLKLVCSSGKIMVGYRPTNLTSDNVECVGGSTVKLSDTFFYAPLKLFGCSDKTVATVRLTDRKTHNGKSVIAEIGYNMGLINFLPVVDELAMKSFKGGYVPRWVHFKALPVKADTSSTTKAATKTSSLSAKVSFETVYDAAQQRTRFMKLFTDKALVDKYMPANGKLAFVPGKLISHEDLYYENQRASTNIYETTVPVWKSVDSGNWKRVGEVVRQIASESASNNVDIWSGSYLQLWLVNAQNKTTYVSLPGDITPPQFLFKYVHDAVKNRGIVYITVNNPHVTRADSKNVICDEIPSCRNQYPEFSDFTKGYTYCCSLAAFRSQATKLGLPLFQDSTF